MTPAALRGSRRRRHHEGTRPVFTSKAGRTLMGAWKSEEEATMTATGALDAALLPAGIRARIVPGINGLDMHVLEAGFETAGRPLVLLLHGFPELAYSWRKVMLPIAAASFHVVAPDQRGYGRTTGWDGDYDGDLGSFGLINIVRDAMALVA